MELTKIAEELGISPTPCQLDGYIKDSYSFSICDISSIEEIDAKFNVFGKYTKKMAECAELVRKNSLLHIYGNAAALYIKEHTLSAAQALRLPEFNYDTPLRFFPLLVFAAVLPHTVKDYYNRGFTDGDVRRALTGSASARVARAEVRNNMQGLDRKGYVWLLNYAKATIFHAGIFGVTPHTYDGHAVVLKNKKTGEYAVLLDGAYDKSGMAFGSTGYDDIENTVSLDFEETEEAYLGYPTKNSRASFERVEYKKSDWEIFLKKGDGVAGIHIPTGTNLSDENVRSGFKEVLERAKEAYPELNIKCVSCTSWLLDPTLTEILNGDSKIVRFLSHFEKFPVVSNEKSIFGHVFPSSYESYETLPEDTSLRRKLKEMYINGKYIYDFGGFVLE